jgi:hypothetical protein
MKGRRWLAAAGLGVQGVGGVLIVSLFPSRRRAEDSSSMALPAAKAASNAWMATNWMATKQHVSAMLPVPAGDRVQDLSGRATWDSIAARVASIGEEARVAREKLDELRETRIPSEDSEAPHLGLAWTLFPGRDRGEIVQAPPPEVAPATDILRRASAPRRN